MLEADHPTTLFPHTNEKKMETKLFQLKHDLVNCGGKQQWAANVPLLNSACGLNDESLADW